MTNERLRELQASTGLDPEQSKYLHQVFIEDLALHLPELKAAREKLDVEAIAKITHKIKAGITFFGTSTLKGLASRLQHAKGASDGFVADIEAFVAEASRLVSEESETGHL